MEELDGIVSTIGGLLELFETDTTGSAEARWDGNEEPDNAGHGEEYRGEEEAVVISELGDGGGRGESPSGTGYFVEDVLDEMR